MTRKEVPKREYRIKLTIRNNLLLTAIEDAGYESQAAFARAAGLRVTTVNAMVGLRHPPINKDGEFSAAAKIIMEVLGAAPTELWTEKQLTMNLPRSTGEVGISETGAYVLIEQQMAMPKALPDPSVICEHEEATEAIEFILKGLDDRTAQVLRWRYGIGKEGRLTLGAIGDRLGISHNRVRQIELKALRQLRDPAGAARYIFGMGGENAP